MFHVRVFKKKEEEGLFIFYLFIFKMAAILFFSPTTVGVSTVQRHIKNERDMLDKIAEHIYSVLIVSLCFYSTMSAPNSKLI